MVGREGLEGIAKDEVRVDVVGRVGMGGWMEPGLPKVTLSKFGDGLLDEEEATLEGGTSAKPCGFTLGNDDGPARGSNSSPNTGVPSVGVPIVGVVNVGGSHVGASKSVSNGL